MKIRCLPLMTSQCEQKFGNQMHEFLSTIRQTLVQIVATQTCWLKAAPSNEKMRIQESHETSTSNNNGCKKKCSQSPRQDIEPQTSGVFLVVFDSFRVPGKPPERQSGKNNRQVPAEKKKKHTHSNVLQFFVLGHNSS